jgi:hypothetical protein
VTDAYSKLNGDVEFRKNCSEKIGLGFELPASNVDVVTIVPKSKGLARTEQALVNQG